MADVYYYVDDAGQQQGPIAVEQIVGLVRRGIVRAETLTWTAGMSDWLRADAVAALAAAFPARASPPPMRRAVAATTAAPGALAGAFPAWGLFWRTIVLALGVAFVLPAPWAGVWYYKWFAGKIALPGDRPLRLNAEVGEIWWLFVGLGLVQWLGPALEAGLRAPPGVGAISSLLAIVFGWAILRWFVGHLATDDGATKVVFAGGLLGYIGWSLLTAISFLTIIGWAWAFKYFLRWICRNIDGSPRLEFHGGGLAILWRALVVFAVSMLVIPIPWMMKWFANWIVSQVSAAPEARA